MLNNIAIIGYTTEEKINIQKFAFKNGFTWSFVNYRDLKFLEQNKYAIFFIQDKSLLYSSEINKFNSLMEIKNFYKSSYINYKIYTYKDFFGPKQLELF